MSGERIDGSVLLAGPEELDRVIAPIVLGFASDPFVRWLLPASPRFLTYFPQVIRIHAASTVSGGGVYRRGDFCAAAVWYPPNLSPDGDALGAVLEVACSVERVEQVTTILKEAAGYQPSEPHWYLRLIGVDPRLRGQGHGSTLMQARLDDLDQRRESAYLEATSPRSRTFYERHGFETIGEVQGPEAPPLWPMLRAPSG